MKDLFMRGGAEGGGTPDLISILFQEILNSL